MEANKQYPQGRNLCYTQYVSKFVYLKRNRLIWVFPCICDLYYLMMMLTMVKGPMSYEDIRKVSDIQYSTFRDADFAMSILKDDR
ncbi:hypothetical protein Lal_00031953 [Lupinus albus]|nr:hypothetical protein Lal_00031953 [Lupinus albus]